MKTCLSILLLFTLVSCGSAPTIEPTNQCSPVFVYVTDDTGKEFIDVSASYCLCRKYVFSIDQVGPQGGAWREPVKSCDRVVGWKAKEYGAVAEYWQRVREYLLDIMEEHGY